MSRNLNTNVNRGDSSREKLLKILQNFKDLSSNKLIKIPKNYCLLLRKIYKYIKPNINLININFNDLEEIDREKQFILGIDDFWILIKLSLKEWIFNFFSSINFMINTNEQISSNLDFFLLNCFVVIKEVCRRPPKEILKFTDKIEIKKELLYILLDYFIILDEKDIFIRCFDQIIHYSENSNLSYKFYIILKKFCLKYFNQIEYVRDSNQVNLFPRTNSLISNHQNNICYKQNYKHGQQQVFNNMQNFNMQDSYTNSNSLINFNASNKNTGHNTNKHHNNSNSNFHNFNQTNLVNYTNSQKTYCQHGNLINQNNQKFCNHTDYNSPNKPDTLVKFNVNLEKNSDFFSEAKSKIKTNIHNKLSKGSFISENHQYEPSLINFSKYNNKTNTFVNNDSTSFNNVNFKSKEENKLFDFFSNDDGEGTRVNKETKLDLINDNYVNNFKKNEETIVNYPISIDKNSKKATIEKIQINDSFSEIKTNEVINNNLLTISTDINRTNLLTSETNEEKSTHNLNNDNIPNNEFINEHNENYKHHIVREQNYDIVFVNDFQSNDKKIITLSNNLAQNKPSNEIPHSRNSPSQIEKNNHINHNFISSNLNVNLNSNSQNVNSIQLNFNNGSNININDSYFHTDPFIKFIDLSMSFLKTNAKENDNTNKKNSFFSIFFSKKKFFQSKELDGSNIMDFFTILNICEEYSIKHLNNLAVFSLSYELIKFLFMAIKSNINMNYFNSLQGNLVNVNIPVGNIKITNTPLPEDDFEKILWSMREMKSVLHSYCIRIFDQSENYLESNKNKTVFDKLTEYNLNLIEACVWESLKIINIICKFESSLVSNINMRMKQVYERIALKQSGLVFLEILQFFIENCNMIIIDLDYYVSQFFKLKLRFNYKNEILSFTTLEFLYKNKEILNQKTQVFNSFFPIMIKIFATFPKYLDTKFFQLVDYMTKPTTITELFNYILDLPAIILIIENFECFVPNQYLNENNFNCNNKIEIENIFTNDFEKLISFLLRDESFGQEYLSSLNYINIFDKQLKYIFDNLVFTSRVHSTTKIVPKLMKKFFDVIIQRDECESASETIILIFDRFSHFHENEHYKQEIRNLLIRKLEEIFKKWPKIVTTLRKKILFEINYNYSNSTKRELICLLCWSLGEFLDKQDNNSFEDEGISETFKCLEKLLREKIIFFSSKSKVVENSNLKGQEPLDEALKWYSTYFIDKTTNEEILNERLLIIMINTLCKLCVKFKCYVSKTIQCFKDVSEDLINNSLSDKLYEMLVSLEHMSITTEYFV